MDRKDELNFHYLLSLMRPLHNVKEYAWLPELFSIIGAERLILLSKYCGGETVTIPSLDELSSSIEALEWFYKVEIEKKASVYDIPKGIYPYFAKIAEVYSENAREY